MNILSVKNLNVSYSKKTAIENVSLDIKQGQYVCLLGNNGSGKSTLLKSIIGLVPIESGQIIHSLDFSEISYLPQQNPVSKGFPATVYEVVQTGTQKRSKRLPFYSPADKRLAKEAMEKMGITDIANKRMGEMSGGQQQRVMLARAICRKPKLLLLDEPCAGLDINITKEIYTILKSLNNSGVTVIMASHDMEEVGQYANRFIVMNQKVEFDGGNNDWHYYHHHRRCHHE